MIKIQLTGEENRKLILACNKDGQIDEKAFEMLNTFLTNSVNDIIRQVVKQKMTEVLTKFSMIQMKTLENL